MAKVTQAQVQDWIRRYKDHLDAAKALHRDHAARAWEAALQAAENLLRYVKKEDETGAEYRRAKKDRETAQATDQRASDTARDIEVEDCIAKWEPQRIAREEAIRAETGRSDITVKLDVRYGLSYGEHQKLAPEPEDGGDDVAFDCALTWSITVPAGTADRGCVYSGEPVFYTGNGLWPRVWRLAKLEAERQALYTAAVAKAKERFGDNVKVVLSRYVRDGSEPGVPKFRLGESGSYAPMANEVVLDLWEVCDRAFRGSYRAPDRVDRRFPKKVEIWGTVDEALDRYEYELTTVIILDWTDALATPFCPGCGRGPGKVVVEEGDWFGRRTPPSSTFRDPWPLTPHVHREMRREAEKRSGDALDRLVESMKKDESPPISPESVLSREFEKAAKPGEVAIKANDVVDQGTEVPEEPADKDGEQP